MGQLVGATCRKCGHSFELSEGGGFVFHRLRCDRCGKEKSVAFDDLGDLHRRYIKGSPFPAYCVATWDRDQEIKRDYPGDPVSEEEYHRGVEKFAGACACGGTFKLGAPARCPKCRSRNIKKGEIILFYD